VTKVKIEEFLCAFWRSDWDVCSSMLAPDALYVDPLLDNPVRGREAVLETLEFCHSWALLEPRLVSLFGDGRSFCAEIRVIGTITRSVTGIPEEAVGRSFDFAEADVFRTEGGLIRRMSVYADVPGFRKQIGA